MIGVGCGVNQCDRAFQGGFERGFVHDVAAYRLRAQLPKEVR